MGIWDANKLLLFIAFVIPDIVSLKTYELLFPGAPKGSDKLLIDAVAYSSINYALLLFPIYAVEIHQIRQSHPTAYRVVLCLRSADCANCMGMFAQEAPHDRILPALVAASHRKAIARYACH